MSRRLLGALVAGSLALSFAPLALDIQAATTTEFVDYRLADGTIIHTCRITDAGFDPATAVDRPVVLEWTNYNIDSAATGPSAGCPPQFKTLATDLVGSGYVYVAGQTRGVGASSGQPDFWSTQSGRDGAELIELLAAEPWSSGKVGLVGCSSSAMEGLQVAAQAPPSLAAVALGCFAVDTYRGAYYPGGLQAYTQFTVTARLGPDVEPGGAARLATEHGDTSVLHRPVTDALVAATAFTTREDGVFWRDKSTVDRLGDIAAPMYAFGNWADFFGRGPFEWARGHLGADDRLLVAPGWHGDVVANGGTRSMNRRAKVWFDHWLRGAPLDFNGVLPGTDDAPVTYYDLDGGFAGANIDSTRWRTAAQWPPAGLDWQRWYLHEGPSGTSTSVNDGTLSTTAPAGPEAADVYTYPMANLGTTTNPRGFGQPSRNGAALEDSGGALTYTSAPLAQAVSLAGPITVTLHASSSALDTDFVVRLLSVAPDGSFRDVSNGWLKASHRRLDQARSLRNADGDLVRPYHPRKVREWLTPNQPETFEIEVWQTATTVPAGHRLRLFISSQDPYFYQDIAPAVNTVFHDSARPSSVLLPVLPAA